VIIPKEKGELIQQGYAEVEQIMENYNMGFITYNERYNQNHRYMDPYQLQVV
jgi:DNA-directed RNA polymerase subunit beta'